MIDELRDAVQRSYEVFASYAKSVGGGKLNVCRCASCVDEASERTLMATRLREIPSNIMAQYTDSCHGWDDEQISRKFRYFLPRYFDLLAQYDGPDTIGLDSCLRRMGEASWLDKWPEEEVNAINAFFEAYVKNTLLQLGYPRPGGAQLDDIGLEQVLLMIVVAGGDIERLLKIWETADDPGAAVNMACMRQRITWKDGDPNLSGWAGMESAKSQGHRVAEFLLRHEVDARLEKAFFLTEDPNWQSVLSDAAAVPPSTPQT